MLWRTERDEAGLGCPARVIRPFLLGEQLYGISDVTGGEYSAHDLRMLHDDVSRMVPNWRLVYDGDLLEAARDLGLLDEDDPADGDYDELDLSEEASWRRLSCGRYMGDEEDEDDAEGS